MLAKHSFFICVSNSRQYVVQSSTVLMKSFYHYTQLLTVFIRSTLVRSRFCKDLESKGLSVRIINYIEDIFFFFGERSKFISSSGYQRLYFHEWRVHDLSQKKKKKPHKYSVYFMLLTLSGRRFNKIQYSSFPLFPVAYPTATHYNITFQAREM